MANVWASVTGTPIQVIAAEALRHLEDRLTITNLCAKDITSDFTTKANGWKKGDTVPFRTHGDFYVDEFASTIEIQPISSSSRSMTIEKHFDVSCEVTSREQALYFDSFADQVLRPASYRIAEAVEKYVASKLAQASGMYASTALLVDAADAALARKAANLQQLEPGRFAIVNPSLEATLLGATWFNQAATRGGMEASLALREGAMGRLMGIDWFSSMQFPTISRTTGTMTTGTTNNNAGANNKIGDTSLVMDAVTATQTLTVGDRLFIAGCRRPVIVKTAIGSLTTTPTVELVDPITEIIPDNATVTVMGQSTSGTGTSLSALGCIFDNRSLAMAMPLLDAPDDKNTATASNNGITLRVVKGYDMAYKKTTMSIDCLCGAFALDPRRMTLLNEF